MATILISELNEYLSLHPYWNKLTEIQKINTLNNALSKFKKDKVLYVGNINKCYYPYDTYKTNINKILENINFPKKYLPLLIQFSTYKLHLNLYQYTYEKKVFTHIDANLLSRISLKIKDKVVSIVKNKVLPIASFHPKTIIQEVSRYLKNNINTRYSYKIYNYSISLFSNSVNLKYLLIEEILKKNIVRKINLASVFINEKLKRNISFKPYLINKISEKTVNKKQIITKPIYSKVYYTDILINKFPKNSIKYLMT